MGDIRENQMTESGDIIKVRTIDSNDNSILSRVDQLTDKTRMVSPDSDGLMSKDLLRSIFHNSVLIPAGGTYNTEITNGGIIMVQNQSAEHGIALALLYADGDGRMLSPSVTEVFWQQYESYKYNEAGSS